MDYKIIKFPKIYDPRGTLTFMQFPEHIPFEIERVFWTYDVPGGEIRGGHAYNKQEEIIIALSGSFDLVITNKHGSQEIIQMKSPHIGVYLPPKSWRHLENFSTNSLSLHLSSMRFSAGDYIRDLEKYFELDEWS